MSGPPNSSAPTPYGSLDASASSAPLGSGRYLIARRPGSRGKWGAGGVLGHYDPLLRERPPCPGLPGDGRAGGCTREDLNLHVFRRRNLNPVRMPFRHSCDPGRWTLPGVARAYRIREPRHRIHCSTASPGEPGHCAATRCSRAARSRRMIRRFSNSIMPSRLSLPRSKVTVSRVDPMRCAMSAWVKGARMSCPPLG